MPNFNNNILNQSDFWIKLVQICMKKYRTKTTRKTSALLLTWLNIRKRIKRAKLKGIKDQLKYSLSLMKFTIKISTIAPWTNKKLKKRFKKE